MARKKTAKLPQCVRRHPSGRYRAAVTIDGKRIVGPLRETVDHAVEDRDRIKAARQIDTEMWTLRRGLEHVYADLDASGARPATRKYYENHARILFEIFDPEALLHEVTDNDIRAYIGQRLDDGISLQTVWGKELQVLERIINLAVKRDMLARSPFKDLRRPKLRAKRRDEMTVDRLAAALEKIRNWRSRTRHARRDADIIALAFLTGMRRAELARLKVSDVDLAAGHLFVEGKNDNRYVPVLGELENVVRRLLAESDGELLVGGERLIEKLFARWKERLGEPLLVPRSMRHGFATDQASNGLNPFQLQSLMGHANLRQTQRYYHSQDEQSRSAVRSAGARLAERTRAAEQSEQAEGADPPTTR